MKIASLAALSFAAAMTATVPAHASGFGTFYAQMLAGGTVASSSGVASAARTAVGKYSITFNRSLLGCATMVSLRGSTSGYGTSMLKGGSPTVVWVFTYNAGGALTNKDFNIFAICNT